MEWSDIASTVGKYAPVVSGLLFPQAAAAIGVGTVIAKILGVDQNPSSVLKYLTENPEDSKEKLQVYEVIKKHECCEKNQQ